MLCMVKSVYNLLLLHLYDHEEYAWLNSKCGAFFAIIIECNHITFLCKSDTTKYFVIVRIYNYTWLSYKHLYVLFYIQCTEHSPTQKKFEYCI